MKNWFAKKIKSKKIEEEKKLLFIKYLDINEVIKEEKIKKNRNKERKIKDKRGSAIITDTFILIVSLLIISITTMFMVSILTPFIYYQKLQMTAQKYMYIIERYGSLTSLEINQMSSELENQGFKKDKIKISVPSTMVNYGEEILFEVKYTYSQKIPTLDYGITMANKDVDLVVRKVSIAKI